MTNERKIKWNYPLLEVAEHKIGAKTTTPRGKAYELVGTDLSIKEGIRPFPGFTRIHRFSAFQEATNMNEKSEIVDLFPISFRSGSDKFGYGWVYRAKQEPTKDPTESTIFVDYYMEDQGWTYASVISTEIPVASPMDVRVFNKYVYILIKDVEPILWYVDYTPTVAASGVLTIQDYTKATLGVSATCVDGLNLAGVNLSTVNEVLNFENLTVAAGCEAGTTTIILDEDSTTGAQDAAANIISIGVSGVADDEALTDLMVKAINGTADSRITFATGDNGTAGIAGITAAEGSTTTEITLTMDQVGATGNIAPVLTEDLAGANMVAVANFTGGVGDSFIIRNGIGTEHTIYPISGTGTNLSGVTTYGTFKVETSNDVTATNLASCINGSSYFVSAAPSANTVDITQALVGSAGNTIITLSQTDTDFATKTNFTGGEGYAAGPYVEIVETDTGPGPQIKIISPGDIDEVAPGSLGVPSESHVSHAQVFLGTTVGDYWDATPEGMDDPANLEAGNYAIGYVLNDPETGRKTSLSKLAQVTEESLITHATGKLTVNTETPGDLTGHMITINDGTHDNVVFTFDDSTATSAKVTATTYTIGISGDTSYTAIASSIYDAIKIANDEEDLNITPSDPSIDSDAFTDLTHDLGTEDGNQPISHTAEGDLTAVGMSGAANFDPGYIAIEIIYDSSKFTQAHIYRSIKVESAGGSYSAAIVQLDQIITLLDFDTTDQSGMTGDFRRAIYYYTLTDLALIYQDPYTDRSIFDENMPKAGTGIEFDGIFLVSNISSMTSSSSDEIRTEDPYRGLGEFRWSSMSNTNPELFPPENYFTPSKITNQVITFERNGGMVLGFANNIIMHISREFTGVSSYLKILPIHEGYGIVNAKAKQSVGPFTYFVNDKGLKTIDAQGRLDSLHALDGLINEWKDDLNSVSMSYDTRLSTLFIHNPTKQETALLWFSTSSISELHDTPFSLTVTGSWPNDLSDNDSNLIERAMFLQNQPSVTYSEDDFAPGVWVVDSKREDVVGRSSYSDFNGEQRITLLHFDGDVRFTIDSYISGGPGLDKITLDTDYLGHEGQEPFFYGTLASWVGCYVYCIESSTESSVGKKAQIQKTTGSDALYIQNISSGWTPAAGERIALSPVYVKWEGSIIGFNESQNPQDPNINGVHVTRNINSAGCYFSEVEGAPTKDTVDSDDLFYKFSLYEGTSLSPIASGTPKDLSGNKIKSVKNGESTYWAAPEVYGVTGMVLSPGLEVFCPDLDFKLLSVIIEGKILSSIRTERPS